MSLILFRESLHRFVYVRALLNNLRDNMQVWSGLSRPWVIIQLELVRKKYWPGLKLQSTRVTRAECSPDFSNFNKRFLLSRNEPYSLGANETRKNKKNKNDIAVRLPLQLDFSWAKEMKFKSAKHWVDHRYRDQLFNETLLSGQPKGVFCFYESDCHQLPYILGFVEPTHRRTARLS